MKLTRLLTPLLALVALAGCAMLPESPTGQAAMRATQVALTTYASVYQPAVIAYGRLPDCPAAAICKDRPTLEKLKATDLAVTATIVAAQGVLNGTTVDTGQLVRAMSAIQAAQVQIAGSGALTNKQ